MLMRIDHTRAGRVMFVCMWLGRCAYLGADGLMHMRIDPMRVVEYDVCLYAAWSLCRFKG